MPSAPAAPTRNDVRAASVTRNAPTAPIGIAIAQPVTRPETTTSSTGRILAGPRGRPPRDYGGCMRITKFGHACVRVENDGRTVVLDPGMFTDVEALDGA